MTEEKKPTLWLVEVVWDGEVHRTFHYDREEATAHLVRLADDLADFTKSNPTGRATKDDMEHASQWLLDDDRSAWVDCLEITESGICPKCGAMAGWSGGYCEPCGYEFGDDPNAD